MPSLTECNPMLAKLEKSIEEDWSKIVPPNEIQESGNTGKSRDIWIVTFVYFKLQELELETKMMFGNKVCI